MRRLAVVALVGTIFFAPSCAAVSNGAGALVEHGATATLTAGTAVAFGTGYGIIAYPIYRWGGAYLSKKLFDSETVRVHNPPNANGIKPPVEETLRNEDLDRSSDFPGTKVGALFGLGLPSFGDTMQTFLLIAAVFALVASGGIPLLWKKITAASNTLKKRIEDDDGWTAQTEADRREHRNETRANANAIALLTKENERLRKEVDELWDRLIDGPKP